MASPLIQARDSLFRQLILNRSRKSKRWSKRLRDNVLAVELARKLTAGLDTGRWSLRVVVRRKYRRQPVDLADRLPKTWRGVAVDVVQGGPTLAPLVHCYPNVRRRLVEPPGIIGGVSIGPQVPPNLLGTAAAVVRRGNRRTRYLLTCRHVVEPLEDLGGVVIQPGGARRRPRRIGRVVDRLPLHFDGTPNLGDAALVELDPGIRATRQWVNCLGTLTGIITDHDELRERVDQNQVVRTAGAATGRPTWGTLAAIESGIRVRYASGREAIFDRQIAVRPAQPDPLVSPRLARQGDSGALLVIADAKNRLHALGLLFATTDAFAYAAPIGEIVRHFDIQFT